jgi:hypothetical protein
MKPTAYASPAAPPADGLGPGAPPTNLGSQVAHQAGRAAVTAQQAAHRSAVDAVHDPTMTGPQAGSGC